MRLPILLAVLLVAAPAAAEERARLPRPPDGIADALVWIAHALELAGVAVILGGVAWAAVGGARRLLAEGPGEGAYSAIRADLGRGILLGLELLIAADIIGTVVVEPTLANLAVLGGIVLIRTFLSFALEAELRGHLPWRGRTGTEGAAPPSAG
ncbi:MAG: DUF1622 domain-containing protein [Acetobacteraceae bacterium]|nr:DUF1622 domain-containing protein [Acetobacteraceae bacterium]MDW8397043.1 DUF1622 domain-containing protein [Acetobacteraceae bacterium]